MSIDDLRASIDRCLNPHEKIASFRGHVLVMHTRNDDLVPVSHAERLHAWANEPKELLVFERGDRNTILPVNQEACFAAVGTFMQAAICKKTKKPLGTTRRTQFKKKR